MTEESKALYEALFGLEEIRELLRESAPRHRLNDLQKKTLREKTALVRESLTALEKLG